MGDALLQKTYTVEACSQKAVKEPLVEQFDRDLFVRLMERVVVKEKAVVFGMKTDAEIRSRV